MFRKMVLAFTFVIFSNWTLSAEMRIAEPPSTPIDSGIASLQDIVQSLKSAKRVGDLISADGIRRSEIAYYASSSFYVLNLYKLHRIQYSSMEPAAEAMGYYYPKCDSAERILSSLSKTEARICRQLSFKIDDDPKKWLVRNFLDASAKGMAISEKQLGYILGTMRSITQSEDSMALPEIFGRLYSELSQLYSYMGTHRYYGAKDHNSMPSGFVDLKLMEKHIHAYEQHVDWALRERRSWNPMHIALMEDSAFRDHIFRSGSPLHPPSSPVGFQNNDFEDATKAFGPYWRPIFVHAEMADRIFDSTLSLCRTGIEIELDRLKYLLEKSTDSAAISEANGLREAAKGIIAKLTTTKTKGRASKGSVKHPRVF